jgi:exonuclease SbcC
MIFSRLFNKKNKWQAKDSNVRIAAINEELGTDNSAEKTILLSLLKEDKSELVRRAALLKLNDFDVYVLSSVSNDNAGVKQFALSQVHSILANKHDVRLTLEEKNNFIQQTSSKGFLAHWLEYEQEPSLVVALFIQQLTQGSKQKNTAHFLLQVFTQKQSAEIQQQLLELSLPELSETSLLTKLLKKSASVTVHAFIEEKLAQLLAAKEKPKKLQKQLQLVLAKLLALKDTADYGVYQAKRYELETQWQQGLTSFSCLSEDQQETLTQKHHKITTQLTQIFAPKAEAYQQEKIAQQLQVDKLEALACFSGAIAEINQQITTSVFEDTPLDQQAVTEQLTALEQAISHSVLSEAEQAKLSQQITLLAKRLTQLPEIAQSVTEATHLISKISQLALPQAIADFNDRQKTYNDWLDKWKEVECKASGLLPQSIKDAHTEITSLWRQGLKPLQSEQKQLFIQTKKKLLDIKRLLVNGKYKVCFGLFKGVKQVMPVLSSYQQSQLASDFDHVTEKMAELSDWEHYIATPRKQQLLEEITKLVQTPLDNPNDQADKVKQFRKTWNSFGHAEEDIDKALNEQFNQACEQAFAPCRLFYAEQERLRAQHFIDRTAIIEQASQMEQLFAQKQTIEQTDKEIAANFKQLDGQLNKLQQTWNQAGEVDRKDYQHLQQKFKRTLLPIKNAIKAFHESNSTKKQALILQAQQQLTVDDVFQAIEKVKQLQQQWRDIGFAGSRQENKLWQDFRQVNDQIFAKRAQIKTEQHDAQTELTEQFNQRFADIKATLSAELDKTRLSQTKQEAEALLSSVIAHKPVLKKVAHDIEAFINNIQGQLTTLVKQEQKESWLNLFTLLKNLATDDEIMSVEDTQAFKQLTNFWQKRVHELTSLTNKVDIQERNTKTLAIEILAQVESPAEYAQQRMAVQVELMQEQMSSGAEIDLDSQLLAWLQLGKLTQQDLAMLERLEKVFI